MIGTRYEIVLFVCTLAAGEKYYAIEKTAVLHTYSNRNCKLLELRVESTIKGDSIVIAIFV